MASVARGDHDHRLLVDVAGALLAIAVAVTLLVVAMASLAFVARSTLTLG